MRLFLALLFLAGPASAGTEDARMRLTVLGADTGDPVPGASISVEGGLAALADSAGVAELAGLERGDRVTISAVGFFNKTVLLDDGSGRAITAYLRSRVIDLRREVTVYGTRLPPAGGSYKAADGRTSTEAMLAAVGGVDMIRRANFGLDPTVRGGRGGQVGVTIDGMKVFPACVDQMDPVTGYVENENLDKLEVARGAFDLTQGQAIGGNINLITRKPLFEEALSLYSEAGFETAARHRYSRNAINVAREGMALRGSFSYRAAGDFRPGGGAEIANTQYAKYNYKVDASRRFDGQRLDVGVLGDRAWDIGYPALLMDAKHARSQLFSVTHTWSSRGSRLHQVRTRLYHSRVDHWMYDEERDVTQRLVMRDMNMPMFGRTRTWGLIESVHLAGTDRTLELVLDYYTLGAFAEMKMISLDPAVASNYVINIGDVRRHHLALIGDYNQALSQRWQGKVNARVDAASQSLNDPVGQRNLEARWGAGDLDRSYLTPSISATAEFIQGQDFKLKLGVTSSARIPTQLESYGFFLFNPMDGYFYTGKPGLSPERTAQVEVGLEAGPAHRRIAATAHYSRISDYIAGVVHESDFKTYENISSARLCGFEIEVEWALQPGLRLAGSSSYTRGDNRQFDEPLPFISPWETRAQLSYQRDRYWLDLGLRHVRGQDRIARRTTLEDPTPGFSLLDLRGGLALTDVWKLRLGIENIGDVLYNEHASIDNLASPGRNLAVALELGL